MGRLAESNNKTNSSTPKANENSQIKWGDELHALIEERAYFKSQSRGYEPGHEIQDWIDAEAEIELELYK
jgi:hypothetical protein